MKVGNAKLHDSSKDLVYGHLGGDLVFAVRERALENAAFWEAKTWGELRTTAPGLYAQIVDGMDWAEDELNPPSDEAPFDGGELAATRDDLPHFLAQEMLSFVPETIQQEFGAMASTALDGEILTFWTGDEEVVAAMKAAGFTCTPDERLVARAGGCFADDDEVSRDDETEDA